jgi:hypothetical protein
MAPASVAARRRAPILARRVSGPAHPVRALSPGTHAGPALSGHRGAQGSQRGLAVIVLQALIGLSEHRLLDRLIRGRVWIGIVAFALIGIVAMQLAVLELNTGIGRALARQTALQRQNAVTSIENSALAAGESVEPQATRRGMVIAPAGAIQFLSTSPSDARRAAHVLRSASAGLASAQSSTTTENPTTTSESSPTASEGATAPSESSSTEAQSSQPTVSSRGSEAAEAPPRSVQAQSTSSAGTEASASQSASAEAPAVAGPGGGTQASSRG